MMEEAIEKREKRPRSKSSSATFRSVQIKIVTNVFAGRDHDGSRRMTRLTATRGNMKEMTCRYIYTYKVSKENVGFNAPCLIDCIRLTAQRSVPVSLCELKIARYHRKSTFSNHKSSCRIKSNVKHDKSACVSKLSRE